MSPSIPARGLLALIQLYKWTLSPLIGRECRYLPTCSSYAADAVRKHGAWAGSWMAGARLCRCHPWGGHGWDPAPELKPCAPWYAPWRLGDWKGGYRAVSPPREGRGQGVGRSSDPAGDVPNVGADANDLAPCFTPPPAPSPRGEGERSLL